MIHQKGSDERYYLFRIPKRLPKEEVGLGTTLVWGGLALVGYVFIYLPCMAVARILPAVRGSEDLGSSDQKVDDWIKLLKESASPAAPTKREPPSTD